jgi:hypothetical protein
MIVLSPFALRFHDLCQGTWLMLDFDEIKFNFAKNLIISPLSSEISGNFKSQIMMEVDRPSHESFLKPHRQPKHQN